MDVTRKVHPNGDTYCSQCKVDRTKIARKNNPEKFAYYSWKSRIKKFYNIDEDLYLELYNNQNGKCAICSDDLELKGKSTHIDHNHTTLEVRGLLCHKCNTAIGLFREDINYLNKAITYLSEAGMKKKMGKK